MIEVDIDLYNSDNEEKLKKYPKYAEIKQYCASGIKLEPSDFYTYGMFKEFKRRDGWRTYAELSRKVEDRQKAVNEYFKIIPSISSYFSDRDELQNEKTEFVGVGVGLSIISKLHNLTEADWEKIPEKQTKTLDFFIAAEVDKIIEVECKGTVSDDTETKNSNISGKKRDIEAKKKSTSNQSIKYGVIVVLPTINAKAKAYIIDPEPEFDGDPYKIKLLTRLTYYYRELHSITKSPIVLLLINRINEIRKSERYRELDGIKFLNRSGENMLTPNSFLTYMYYFQKDNVFGCFYHLYDDYFMFCGLTIDCVNMIIGQKYSDILSYKCPSYVSKNLDANPKFRRNDIPSDTLEILIKKEKDEHVEVPLNGSILMNSAGRAFGIFSLALNRVI